MYNRAHRFNRPNVGILLKIHHHNIFRDFGKTLPSILQQILLFEYKKDNKIKFTIYIVLLMFYSFPDGIASPVKSSCQNTCSRATKRNQCHCLKKWNSLHIMCVNVTMADWQCAMFE